MSLLLLLKPHPRRAGRQKLVIQKDLNVHPAFHVEPEVLELTDVEIQQVPFEQRATIDDLVKQSPFFQERPGMAKEFKEQYRQGLAEGVSIEEMVLLFMMTER